MSTFLSSLRSIKRLLLYYGGALKCNVCERPLRRFYPFPKALENAAKLAGFPYDFRKAETLNYENYNCPFCLSSDRERLYLLFLDNFTAAHAGTSHILDFAPGSSFINAIKKREKVTYVTADLFRSDYDLSIDICQMNLPDGQFDIVICSHILEHVPFPDKALSEIRRVLKVGGFAIIMVPLFEGVTTTVEDIAYQPDEVRTKLYGQPDHVRLFAKNDFIKKIEAAKLNLKIYTTKDFDERLIKKYALAHNTFLYVAYKAEL